MEGASRRTTSYSPGGRVRGGFARWWPAYALVLAAACAQAGEGAKPGPQPTTLCSQSWYRWIEQKVPTGDGQGHGPDVGSDEWKSVVEFKLGLRGKPDVPGRDSETWCRYIDQAVRGNRMPPTSGAKRGAGARGPG